MDEDHGEEFQEDPRLNALKVVKSAEKLEAAPIRIDIKNLAEMQIDHETEELLNALEKPEYEEGQKHEEKIMIQTFLSFMESGELEEVVNLLDAVEEDYPEILTLVINPILKLMGRTNEDQLFSLFEKFLFKEKNYLNLSSFHLIMNLYANKGDPLLMDDVFKKLQLRGFTPNDITYAIRILGYGKAGELEQSLGAFQEMIKNGIYPSEFTMVSLLQVCGRYNRIDLIEQFRKFMVEDLEIQPHVETYEVLIHFYGKHGQFLEMFRLFDAMHKAQETPTTRCYLKALDFVKANEDFATPEVHFWLKRFANLTERNAEPTPNDHKQFKILTWKLKSRLSYFDFVNHKLAKENGQKPSLPPPYPHLDLEPLKPNKLWKQQQHEKRLQDRLRKESTPPFIVLPKPLPTKLDKLFSARIAAKELKEKRFKKRMRDKEIDLKYQAKHTAIKQRNIELKKEKFQGVFTTKEKETLVELES